MGCRHPAIGATQYTFEGHKALEKSSVEVLPDANLILVEFEEDGVFQISGERTKEREEKNDRWHRVKRSSGKFLRRFRLSENAKIDQVNASMENGVTT